jgi:hypothetical protein
MNILHDILIFKTNIHQRDMIKVASVMNAEKRILKWNVDCTDVDHVLRVEVQELCMDEVIELIHHAGFVCEELVD